MIVNILFIKNNIFIVNILFIIIFLSFFFFGPETRMYFLTTILFITYMLFTIPKKFATIYFITRGFWPISRLLTLILRHKSSRTAF